jgi:hypothetical protein
MDGYGIARARVFGGITVQISFEDSRPTVASLDA